MQTKIITKFFFPFDSFAVLLLVIFLTFFPMPNEGQEFADGYNFCDPNPCEYEGICQSTQAGYICTCPDGTIGYNCEINIDDCILSLNSTIDGLTKCQQFDKEAICIDELGGYKCECSEQYFGDNCEIPSEDSDLIELFNAKKDPNLIALIEMLIQDPTLFHELAPFFLNTKNETAKNENLSWTIDDLFVWASFAGQELEMETELTTWNDPTLGNCFTFGQSGKIYDVADSGENYGFQALLQLNEEDYLPWIETSSINVFVQRRNEHIFINSLHYSSPPGSSTQMMLTERNVGRLDGVYGECINGTKEVHTFYYPGIYTIIGCLQSCYQNQVHLVCGCTDPRYLGIGRKIPICGLDKALCVLNVTKVYGDPTTWDSCACPEACSETYVDVLWYNSDFPSRPVQCWNLSGNALNECIEPINDQIELSVFFKYNFVEEYNETPSQTFNQWLLQFGGITGIIAGFCFISIIEFIFFLYRTFLTFCTNEAVTQDTRELQFIDEEDADFDVFAEPIVLKQQPATTTEIGATKEKQETQNTK